MSSPRVVDPTFVAYDVPSRKAQKRPQIQVIPAICTLAILSSAIKIAFSPLFLRTTALPCSPLPIHRRPVIDRPLTPPAGSHRAVALAPRLVNAPIWDFHPSAVLLNHHARKRIVRVARTFTIAGHDPEPGPEFEPPPRKFELIICSHEAAATRAGPPCLYNGSERLRRKSVLTPRFPPPS